VEEALNNIPMEILMKVIGLMTNKKARVFLSMPMEILLKVIG
jgi:hypothetical protein